MSEVFPTLALPRMVNLRGEVDLRRGESVPVRTEGESGETVKGGREA